VANKSKKGEKIYNFKQVIYCDKCGTVSEEAVPCEKCGGKVFKTYLELQEI
jgi:rRNA maturation endonuclease Nob1